MANLRDRSTHGHLLVGVLGIVILAGGVATYWAGRSADGKARLHLMERTATAAAAINPQYVMALTGTEVFGDRVGHTVTLAPAVAPNHKGTIAILAAKEEHA